MAKASGEILFFTGDIRFSIRNKPAISEWLRKVSKRHKKKITALSYIFVSDKYLLEINKKFLHHNTLTDIITFDYSAEQPGKNDISGEIYISIERVRENAEKYAVTVNEELHRVMAHGLLHLCGFGDKSVSDKRRMRTEEENALVLRQF